MSEHTWQEIEPGCWVKGNEAFVTECDDGRYFAWSKNFDKYGTYNSLDDAKDSLCPF